MHKHFECYPLVDVTGTGKTVPSSREKRFEKKLYKRRINSPTVVNVFENKFGQVVEKSLQASPLAVNFERGVSLKRFRYLPATFHFRAESDFARARKTINRGKGL